MTYHCPSALWPSISPIVETTGNVALFPIVERDELEEGHEEVVDQVEAEHPEPAQGIVGPPEPHAEMRAPRISRRPVLPTKAEIDEHLPLHLNFRSWCAHSVAGKARLAQHIIQPSDRERLGVTIHMDYAFMTAEEAEESMQPTLVIYCLLYTSDAADE